MAINQDIYPNAPLIQTAFEIRFPGEPRIECHKDDFFELIRKDFPRVLVPQIAADSYPAFNPYRFEKEDQSASVMISINKFIYLTRSYFGYQNFKQEVKDLVGHFIQLYKITSLNRTGLRYINIIPYSRESDAVPLERILKIKLDLPNIFPKTFNNFAFTFLSKTGGGAITTKIETVIAADNNNEAILLDFDYAKENDLTVEKIDDYLDESHTHTKQVFEDLITDEYKQYISGDTI